MSTWTKANVLSSNVSKTFRMIFPTREVNNDNYLVFDGERVRSASEGKFLKLILDSGLNYKDDISLVCTTVSKSMGIFYKLKNLIPRKILLNLYYTFIYSYLTYCNTMCGGTHASSLEPLFVLQKKGSNHC